MGKENFRLQRCCFSGHRPGKLGLGERETKQKLKKAIDASISDGFVTFITGMAMGADIWAAEIILERKKKTRNYT